MNPINVLAWLGVVLVAVIVLALCATIVMAVIRGDLGDKERGEDDAADE